MDIKLKKNIQSQLKKGFTLIEMVIVLAVLIIILSFITSIFVQIMRIETGIADIAQMEIIAAESTTELLDDLKIAKSIDLTSATELKIVTDDYSVSYSVHLTDGILMREYANDDPPGAKPVLSKGFYMGHTMELLWSSSGDASTNDYTVTLDVTIFEQDGDEVYSEQYVVRPTIINANG